MSKKLGRFPEQVIYCRRIIANPFILQDMHLSHKIFVMATLGTWYFRTQKFEEAAILFKRVVDANNIALRDNWRFLLILCYYRIGDAETIDITIDMLVSLYCQRVYDFDLECLAACVNIPCACLREWIYNYLSDYSKRFIELGLRCTARAEVMKLEHPEDDWGAYILSYINMPLMFTFIVFDLLYRLRQCR